MIKHKNGIVSMALVDLEHCGFDVEQFHEELQILGIGAPMAHWPIALLVNFRGGAVVTDYVSPEETRTRLRDNRKFERLHKILDEANRPSI